MKKLNLRSTLKKLLLAYGIIIVAILILTSTLCTKVVLTENKLKIISSKGLLSEEYYPCNLDILCLAMKSGEIESFWVLILFLILPLTLVSIPGFLGYAYYKEGKNYQL